VIKGTGIFIIIYEILGHAKERIASAGRQERLCLPLLFHLSFLLQKQNGIDPIDYQKSLALYRVFLKKINFLESFRIRIEQVSK
jgi:hypothetical protein